MKYFQLCFPARIPGMNFSNFPTVSLTIFIIFHVLLHSSMKTKSLSMSSSTPAQILSEFSNQYYDDSCRLVFTLMLSASNNQITISITIQSVKFTEKCGINGTFQCNFWIPLSRNVHTWLVFLAHLSLSQMKTKMLYKYMYNCTCLWFFNHGYSPITSHTGACSLTISILLFANVKSILRSTVLTSGTVFRNSFFNHSLCPFNVVSSSLVGRSGQYLAIPQV